MTSDPERGTSTRALLDELAEGDPADLLALGDLLDGLGQRGFGVLLFLAIPPSFFPGVAAIIGSPVIIAISAPTALAIRTAEEAGMTLIALVRGDEFEIFTGAERIVSGPARRAGNG